MASSSSDAVLISDLKQLKSIVNEIKRHSAEMRVLRLKKKEIEERILDVLMKKKEENGNDFDGIRYENIYVFPKERHTHKRLKKKEKETNIKSILNEMGIAETDRAYSVIMDAMKGEEVVSNSLQIKEPKDK